MQIHPRVHEISGVVVGACVRELTFWPVIVLHDCRFALVAVLVVLGFLVTVFVSACVP